MNPERVRDGRDCNCYRLFGDRSTDLKAVNGGTIASFERLSEAPKTKDRRQRQYGPIFGSLARSLLEEAWRMRDGRKVSIVCSCMRSRQSLFSLS